RPSSERTPAQGVRGSGPSGGRNDETAVAAFRPVVARPGCTRHPAGLDRGRDPVARDAAPGSLAAVGGRQPVAACGSGRRPAQAGELRARLDARPTRSQHETSRGRGARRVSAVGRPADAAKVVWLPSDSLEEDGVAASPEASPALLAAAGRALQSLVPEAKARSRHVN